MGKVKTVCIIDDDKIYRYTIEKYIKILNLAENVIVYADGEQALDFIESNATNVDKLPDVIFLDVNMPMLDGWEFIEEYSKVKSNLAKDIKIYMVSSSIDERDRNRANDIPEISDFIIKPIEEDRLKSLIREEAS